jgi:hypothetical protein
MVVKKGLLKTGQCSSGGLPFNSLDLGPLRFGCENQAGIHRFSVQQDSARAALPRAAPFLRSREAEVVPQKAQKRPVPPNITLAALPVYRKSDTHFSLFPPSSVLPLERAPVSL